MIRVLRSETALSPTLFLLGDSLPLIFLSPWHTTKACCVIPSSAARHRPCQAEHQSPCPCQERPLFGVSPRESRPPPNGAFLQVTQGKHRPQGAGKNRQEDLDWASRTASEEQMTPSVTRGDATGRHADSTNSPICPAECSAGHAGTGNGLLAVARTRKAANGPLPGNHTGGSEHCQCHDTARRCRAPDARANKKRPPKRAPVQSGTSEGIKLRGWGPGRHPAGSHPRPCRRPQ